MELGELKLPGVKLPFTPKLGRTRSRNIDLETSFLAYDDKAAEHWLQEYFNHGGDMGSIQHKVNRGTPLSALPFKERGRFVASLRPADRAMFDEAQEWSDRGKEAMRRKLGEGTFTIPERTRPVASVYDNPEEDSP